MADLEGIFADLSTLAGPVNSAEGGLPAIQGLVEFTQPALGAAGASFAEYGTAGGRVIAPSGASLWTVGRQVDAAAGGLGDAAGGRIVELPVERLPAEAGQLSGRGIRWMLATRVEVAGVLVGTLHGYFTRPGTADPAQRSALALVAGVTAHLYGDGRGLPVYAETPAVATLADAIAVVGPDGVVRSWNPAAAMVVGRSASAALGHPLPVPLPALGQVIEHRLPDGRWLPGVGGGWGRASPVPLPFALGEGVRSAGAALPADPRRRVRVELPEAVPKALGERASLATVLAELITNATKYSPPDVSVEVS